MAGGEVGVVYVSVIPRTKGFLSALGKLGSSGGQQSGNQFVSGFGQIVGGSALGNIVSNAFGKVVGAVSSSFDSAVSRTDTIANFPKVMKNLGYGADEADRSINTLTAGIDGLPTSLDGAVSMTQQLAPLCGGLDKATSLSLAMNNMFLASNASIGDQQRAMQQYTQMLSRGKVELNDWRTLQEVMPGQLNQVAQALLGVGANSTDLYDALKDGRVSLSDFNGAVERLNKEGINGFASFEDQAKSATEGIGTAVTNGGNRVSKAISKVLDHIGQAKISGVINSFTSQFGAIADVVIDIFDGITSKIDFAGFEAAFGGVREAMGSVFAEGGTATSFGEQVGGAINMLVPVIQMATPVIQALATAFKFAAENIGWLAPVFLALMLAFKYSGLIQTAATGLLSLGASASKAAPKVAKNTAAMLKMGAATLAMGAGIALAAAGLWLIANASIQLASAGWPAIAVMVGMVAAIAGLAVLFSVIGPALTASAVGMLAFGAAVLLVGAGLLLAGAGALLLSAALPMLSEYAAQGALAFLALTAPVALLGVAALVCGVGLAVLGVGLLVCAAVVAALGIGLMIVGVALLLAGAGATILAGSGMMAATGLMMLAVGALMAGPALLIVGVGALVAMAGLVAFMAIGAVATAIVLALAAGVGLLAAGAMAMGTGLLMAGTGCMLMATCGMLAVAAIMALSGLSLVAAPGLVALSATLVGASAGFVAFAAPAALAAASLMLMAAGAMLCAAGVLVVLAAASGVSVAIGLIVPAAAAAQRGLDSSTAAMGQSLERLKIKASNTVNQIQRQFSGMRLVIPSPTLSKMPHFYIRGEFNAQTGSVPTIGVNWYARGGIFKRASVVGIAEAGDEMALPLDNEPATRPLANQIADCVVEKQSEADTRMLAALMEMMLILEQIRDAIPKVPSARDMRRMRANARA